MLEIKGKDRDLDTTLSIIKDLLKKVGFNLVEKEVLNPTNNIWSIHLIDNDSVFYTNGKGSSKEAALASAYCEFLERLGNGFFFDDYVLDGSLTSTDFLISPDEKKIPLNKNFKNNLLNKDLWKFYDPENMYDCNTFVDSYVEANSIISLPFNSLLSNELIYFPIELLKNIYASNGLSSGNSKKETLVQGISECIERGVKNYIIQEGLSLPIISDSYLESKNFLSTKKEIESYGYKLLVKDASLNGRFPVICVLLVDQTKGKILSSFGSHPDPEIAIERTLTELLQGRKLNSMVDFSSLTMNLDQVSDYANLESHFINSTGLLHYNIVDNSDTNFKLWNFDLKSNDPLNYLLKLLETEGYNVYSRTVQFGEMWVSRTVIPKLSEIYPPEDLEYDNRNRSTPIKNFLKNYNLPEKELKEALKWFENSYIYGHDNLLKYIGIATDSTLNLTADEVELLILIKLKKLNKVKEILSVGIELDIISDERACFWKCLELLLIGANENIMNSVFSEATIRNGKIALNNEIPIEIFPILSKDFSGMKKHKEILDVYKKYKKLFL